MSAPVTSPRSRVHPVMLAADIEFLAQYYLTPVVAPAPLATRLPRANAPEDTTNGFLRVEFAGGSAPTLTEFDLSVMLHSYGVPKYELQASEISRVATGYLAAATGQTVAGWYVVDVPHVIAPHRLSDPDVALLRYRSLVTWRVTGQTLTE